MNKNGQSRKPTEDQHPLPCFLTVDGCKCGQLPQVLAPPPIATDNLTTTPSLSCPRIPSNREPTLPCVALVSISNQRPGLYYNVTEKP